MLRREEDSLINMASRFSTLFNFLGIAFENITFEALKEGKKLDYAGEIEEKLQAARNHSMAFLTDVVTQIQ